MNTNDLLLTLSVLFSHWFADFLVQTRWQAENKSKNLGALTGHVASYTGTMFCLMFAWCLFSPSAWLPTAEFCVLNGVLHWITDFFTSRATSYLWKKGDIHGFFGMIGLDQFIHVATLIITLWYV